jgi:hypothetical protein
MRTVRVYQRSRQKFHARRMHSFYTGSITTCGSRKGIRSCTTTRYVSRRTQLISTHLGYLTIAAVILGRQWKNESPATKQQFKALADDIKRKHARDHPDYQYSPRRPGEKRRRKRVREEGPSVSEISDPFESSAWDGWPLEDGLVFGDILI